MVTDCVEAMDARKHDEAGIKLLDFTKAETEAEEQIRYNFPGWRGIFSSFLTLTFSQSVLGWLHAVWSKA